MIGPFGTNDAVEEQFKKHMKLHLCPADCAYLSPSEENQKKGEKHWCRKYRQQVFHGCFHPKIIAIKDCKHSHNLKGD